MWHITNVLFHIWQSIENKRTVLFRYASINWNTAVEIKCWYDLITLLQLNNFTWIKSDLLSLQVEWQKPLKRQELTWMVFWCVKRSKRELAYSFLGEVIFNILSIGCNANVTMESFMNLRRNLFIKLLFLWLMDFVIKFSGM